MSKAFTSDERLLLRSGLVKVRWLFTFFLDTGTYYFCDDVEDLTYSGQVYIGASALAAVSDIKSASGLASESITLIIDGTRVGASGYTDPASLFRDILTLKLHQRRVNIDVGIAPIDSFDLTIKKPAYAGKINNARIVDPKLELSANPLDPTTGNLEIVLDSLSHRYNRQTGRTRSHADQQEIDPTDMFYSFVQDTVQKSNELYWGKASASGQNGLITSGTPYGGGGAYSVGGLNQGYQTGLL